MYWKEDMDINLWFAAATTPRPVSDQQNREFTAQWWNFSVSVSVSVSLTNNTPINMCQKEHCSDLHWCPDCRDWASPHLFSFASSFSVKDKTRQEKSTNIIYYPNSKMLECRPVIMFFSDKHTITFILMDVGDIRPHMKHEPRQISDF